MVLSSDTDSEVFVWGNNTGALSDWLAKSSAFEHVLNHFHRIVQIDLIPNLGNVKLMGVMPDVFVERNKTCSERCVVMRAHHSGDSNSRDHASSKLVFGQV